VTTAPAPTRYVALGDSFTAGAAGSASPSFGDRLAEILREASPTLEYVALGDSFTAGAAGSSAPSFGDRLAEILREAAPGLDYTNLATPGALTTEVAERQLPAALELAPEVVSIVCGGNDALLAVRPDVHAHMAAFEDMLETLRTRLPDAVVATATIPDPGRFLPLRQRTAARISRAIERINEATSAAAARHAVPCLDFAAHPEALARGNYARDGYHPSAEACRRAAGAFAAVIGVRIGIHLDTQEAI
jgi:lysophospholipase L1-like esterase